MLLRSKHLPKQTFSYWMPNPFQCHPMSEVKFKFSQSAPAVPEKVDLLGQVILLDALFAFKCYFILFRSNITSSASSLLFGPSRSYHSRLHAGLGHLSSSFLILCYLFNGIPLACGSRIISPCEIDFLLILCLSVQRDATRLW